MNPSIVALQKTVDALLAIEQYAQMTGVMEWKQADEVWFVQDRFSMTCNVCKRQFNMIDDTSVPNDLKAHAIRHGARVIGITDNNRFI